MRIGGNSCNQITYVIQTVGSISFVWTQEGYHKSTNLPGNSYVISQNSLHMNMFVAKDYLLMLWLTIKIARTKYNGKNKWFEILQLILKCNITQGILPETVRLWRESNNLCWYYIFLHVAQLASDPVMNSSFSMHQNCYHQ